MDKKVIDIKTANKTENKTEDDSGVMCFFCGGIIFIALDEDIASIDKDESKDTGKYFVQLKRAFTISTQMALVPARIGGLTSAPINMATEYNDLSLICEGYSSLPKESSQVKSLKDLVSPSPIMSA